MSPKVDEGAIYDLLFAVDQGNHDVAGGQGKKGGGSEDTGASVRRRRRALVSEYFKDYRTMYRLKKRAKGKTKKKRAHPDSDSKGGVAVPVEMTVLLFYKYVPVEDTEGLYLWQKEVGEKLCLGGRVRLGTEGINGTVGGSRAAISLYMEAMRCHPTWGPTFSDVDFKASTADTANGVPFANFWVRKCTEIVVMGCDSEEINARDGGEHLDPTEFHERLAREAAAAEGESKHVLLDVRNLYESAIGTMDGAIRLPTRHFKEFPQVADDLIGAEGLAEKKVFMYCTGGIRCERASAYLRSKGVRDIYQLKGGIHRYIEAFGDKGLFKGKNFLFDRRVSSSRVGKTGPIGVCRKCKTARLDEYSEDRTCAACGVWVLVCVDCREGGKSDDGAAAHGAVCEYCERNPTPPGDAKEK
jgi:predicted sulfurtransferase